MKTKSTPLNFDMDALRAMAVGLELGAFSHAALRLNRSPSAVSMQLRKLETQAGQRLFKRNGRGLVLTEAGDVVLQHARRVLAVNDELGAALGAIARGGVVRVGIPQDFADTALQELLTQYSKTRPQTQVEIKAGRNYALAEDVAKGRLDMAVAFAAVGKGGENRIATVPTVWLGRAKHTIKEPESGEVPLVVFDGPCLFRDVGIDALASTGLPWRLAMTTPSLASVWCGVRAGLGVTVRTALTLPKGIGVVRGLPALPSIEVVLYCAASRTAAVDDFRSLLLKVISSQAGARNNR